MFFGQFISEVSLVEKRKAIRPHSTPTSDAEWDADENVKRIPDDAGAATLRKMYAWVDPEADPDTKAAYKFPHHFTDSDGNVNEASTRACSAGIASLNGGRNPAKIPDDDRKGVWRHLARHLEDAGQEDIPELKSAEPPKEARAGRVLNARNKEKLEQAHALIGEVLESAKDEGDDEVKSAQTLQGFTEYPAARDALGAKVERRSGSAEFRIARQEGGSPTIEGYVAVFGQRAEIWPGIYEELRPGCFRKTLQEGDARVCYNHDPNYILGRVSAGTASFKEDQVGLFLRCVPPDTEWARDLMVSMERGDVRGGSFAFRPVREEWTDLGNDKWLRSLIEVELYEGGPVAFPAYPTTTMEVVRSTLAKAGVDLQSLVPALLRKEAGLDIDPDALRSSLAALRSMLPEGAMCACGRCKSEHGNVSPDDPSAHAALATRADNAPPVSQAAPATQEGDGDAGTQASLVDQVGLLRRRLDLKAKAL